MYIYSYEKENCSLLMKIMNQKLLSYCTLGEGY